MLTKDLTYRGKVISITPCQGGFSGTNDGIWRNCHYLIMEVDGFPGMLFNTQLCNKEQGIAEFEVLDTIMFVAGTYKMAEDRYTIKFKNKVFVPAAKKMTEAETSAPEQPYTFNDEPAKKTSERQYQSSVAGTPWSICLTAAKDFHKDRKTSKDDDVISTLKAYLRSYNQYLDNENEYMK